MVVDVSKAAIDVGWELNRDYEFHNEVNKASKKNDSCILYHSH